MKNQVFSTVRELRKVLRKKDLDGLIVAKAENVRWMTGFSGHDSWALVTGRSVVLITDSRYTEQARGECRGCRIMQRKKALTLAAADWLKGRKAIDRIGIEDTISVSVLGKIRRALRGSGLATVAVSDVVEDLRSIKQTRDVRRIEKAVQIAWDCLYAALKKLRPGMTEQEFAAELEYAMRMRGATTGFDTIAAFGPNGSRNHHQPTRRKLHRNDTVLIDFGARVEGFTCDITRSFAFGRATTEYRRAWETVHAAQQAAIAVIRHGARGVDVDRAAREVIRQSGFPVYGHGTGHGLGLEVHEKPYLSSLNKKERLRSGQVITIEPGIYLPGRFGIRIEDDVLITESGSKILTRDRKYDFSSGNLTVL